MRIIPAPAALPSCSRNAKGSNCSIAQDLQAMLAAAEYLQEVQMGQTAQMSASTARLHYCCRLVRRGYRCEYIVYL